MTLDAIDAWTIAALLAGQAVNGEMQLVTLRCRRVVDHLAGLPIASRVDAWKAYLCGVEDPDAMIEALASVDLSRPPPEPSARARPASLADVRQVMSDQQWLWEGYIPAARISGIAAYEGIGKTRFAMDLARRMWLKMSWPDGQPPTLPAGTPTLWVCADGQQDDLASIAEALGLPDEALFFNTTPDEPYGGTEIDSDDDRARLEANILAVRPGLVFIDTLTNATSFDLCRATDNKAVMTPIRDIAQRTKTTIILLMHLSKEGQALGRRIKGVTRTIMQLESPDPEQPGRLRLWVEKSFAKKPPPLGVTMTDSGNQYDFKPPARAEPGKPGRPRDTREKAAGLIRDALVQRNDRIGNELAAELVEAGVTNSTFWRAVGDMEAAGNLVKDGGKGTGKQAVLHLMRAAASQGPDDVV